MAHEILVPQPGIELVSPAVEAQSLNHWTAKEVPRLLGIYTKEWKIYVHTKTCTQMFIAALFIIAKIWKPPRCPSIGEEINKLWYNQTMEYYSALKRNELSVVHQ